MKKRLLAITLGLLSTICYAQKGSVTGLLVDSINRKTTLNYATVSVFKGTDTILNSYKLTDDKGIFKINNLDFGTKYRLVINAWMYNIQRREITLSADEPNVNLGEIALSEKTNTLNEIVVTSERPPIIVRNDTIEFNAESFKTLPSAVVEDLLKKLPGVAVAADGSIQVNGRAVSKILVDGKEFFGGDQQIATKNLPANIIDKVVVNDDAEAKRRDPDLLAGNTPQIINLKLKKAVKQGAFGKLYAGGGLNERFETGGIMSFFRDTTQVSLLAYGNNINKPGFSIGDVSRIGGFARGGINSMSVNSDGGFSLNNISFGGASSGVQESAGAGANFNTLTKKGIKLNFKYFYGEVDNTITQLIDANQSLGDKNLITNTTSNQRNKNYNHNIGGRLEYQIDSLTDLTIRPTIIINQIRNEGQLLTKNTVTNRLLSDGKNSTLNNSDNIEYDFSTSLWKDFKKAGSYLNTSFNITQSNKLGQDFNTATNLFYDPVSTILIDQLRDNTIRNFRVYLSSSYAAVLSKKTTLNVSASGNYIANENALATFYLDPLNQAYDILIPTLSETVKQKGYKTNTSAGLRWKATKSLNIQPSVVFNTINLNNTFSKNPILTQNYQFIAPQLVVKYKDLTISYSPSFREPDVRYIQPVANNSNPLFIQNGNPNLRPTRTKQVSLNLYKYDVKKSLNYNANLNGSIENSGIIMSRTIDPAGVQTSTPINADGIWRFNASGEITKQFKNMKRQYSVGLGMWSNYTGNIVEVDQQRSKAYNLSFTPRILTRINLNDKFEFNQNYNLSINSSTYDSDFFNDVNYLTHSAESELIVRLPKKMVWETTYRIMYNTQTANGFSNNVQLWNAGLTLLFMKNDRMQLKISVNDILNTNTRNFVSINENTIRNTTTNNLGRHGLLTLTYNIQNFGGKVGGRETMFRF